MARAEKVVAVAELTERFQTSAGAVLTEYRGLTVAQLGELRESLGENATFAVVKNTLTKIAASEAGLADELSGLLSGPSAIAFVRGDVVEAAKGLRDFSKAHPFLVIKGGVLEGKGMTPDEIAKLADLEPRDVLLARLAGAMKASMSGAAATMAALPAQMARLLAALQEKRAASEPAGAPSADDAPAPESAVLADPGPAAEAAPSADAVPADAVPADAVPAGDAAAADGEAAASAGEAAASAGEQAAAEAPSGEPAES
jgi:large subunit ribosomal protein L10